MWLFLFFLSYFKKMFIYYAPKINDWTLNVYKSDATGFIKVLPVIILHLLGLFKTTISGFQQMQCFVTSICYK